MFGYREIQFDQFHIFFIIIIIIIIIIINTLISEGNS